MQTALTRALTRAHTQGAIPAADAGPPLAAANAADALARHIEATHRAAAAAGGGNPAAAAPGRPAPRALPGGAALGTEERNKKAAAPSSSSSSSGSQAPAGGDARAMYVHWLQHGMVPADALRQRAAAYLQVRTSGSYGTGLNSSTVARRTQSAVDHFEPPGTALPPGACGLGA